MPTINLGRIGYVDKGLWAAGTYKRLSVVEHNSAVYSCVVPSTTAEPGAAGVTDWRLFITTPSAGGIGYTPYGDLIATNIQNAINELEDEKAKLAGDAAQPFSASMFTGPLTGDVTGNADTATALTDLGGDIADVPLGAIGTYAFLKDITNSSTDLAPGGQVLGSSLQYASVFYTGSAWIVSTGGTSPGGTWELQGYGVRASGSVDQRYASLFKRIS